MDDVTEREIHELVLDAIRAGRIFAQEWLSVGIIPRGSSKSFVLELMSNLQKRRGLDEMDEERIALVGDQIRHHINELQDGLGDLVMETDMDMHQIFDVNARDMINLVNRWRNFRGAKRALDDKLAAVRKTSAVFENL